MLTLRTAIREINRVGTVTARKLRNLDIETVEDLLFYFPYRYDDFTKVLKINQLKAGENASVVGQVEIIQNKRSFKRKIQVTEALVSDDSGSVKVVWFNQPFIIKNLKEGDKVSLAGKVEEDFAGVYMATPIYEKVSSLGSVHTQGWVPNYHLTSNLTQKQLRYLIKQVISSANQLVDWQPQEIKQAYKLPDLAEAIKKIHFPRNQQDIEQAKTRLAFDELFLVQLQTQLAKSDFQLQTAPEIVFHEESTKNFVNDLPFALTEAQRKAAWEILQDISKEKPMTRLLEGDVGSGKTLVATLAMLNVALAGRQAVLMAPTEILARQHFESICKFLSKFDITVGLLTRSEQRLNIESEAKSSKAQTLSTILKNAKIIIGTHAIIQEKIEFADLALAVVDEQHRFGVEQRKALLGKSGNGLMPHLLSMTATPIPRSLALALYGDLDVSILNQMPSGRKKILTRVVGEDKRQTAYDFVRAEIKRGRQAFIICPLIDLSDKLEVKSVSEEYKKLSEQIYPEFKVGMLHGKLKANEKEQVMKEFLENKTQILVSTSVVEVGVDVPNATVMLIEAAERFGLAQLHQFRGRVGRSDHQSYCLLFADSDSQQSRKRLQALADHHDGFALAKIDLELRGPGEVYGTLQKGFPEFKIASLFDYSLMKQAKEAAEKIMGLDAQLVAWPDLRRKVGEWGEKIHLE